MMPEIQNSSGIKKEELIHDENYKTTVLDNERELSGGYALYSVNISIEARVPIIAKNEDAAEKIASSQIKEIVEDYLFSGNILCNCKPIFSKEDIVKQCDKDWSNSIPYTESYDIDTRRFGDYTCDEFIELYIEEAKKNIVIDHPGQLYLDI